MAADKQFLDESFFQDRLAQFLRIDPSRHFVGIAKTQMYATLRGQIGTGYLGRAMGLHLWFYRAKGQVRHQVGEGELHLGAPPADQHLGGADGIKQLGIAFWRISLLCVQHYPFGIPLIEGHIADQAGPVLAAIPYPWCA
ncbi:hypothetical protein D3C80_1400170 [compost metagenome]